ncbi:MarR family winged helix-turn-helix transcriptional regulator [Agromyces kandeliae]|uniref:Uncharacterized protein n=1 Tax=Agromyces kandeliae TaxID=2666141 RepID=A0A6L5R0T1_9MICO|nr:hypothetical protein [Agromyces kandeliae]MRX43646.1 hypothetical protein [Agromyces kandeliae]
MDTHDSYEDHDHHDRPGEADDADGARDAHEPPAAGVRPLGYWLKVVERRIAAEVDAALADEGVSLRDWRRLNLVAGEVRGERLAERLAARPHKLDDLVERGWIVGEPGEWTLTDAGRDVLDALTERVRAVRDRVRSSVSEEEYATMTASLEAIARELGWDESTPEPRRRRGGPGFRRGFGGRPWMRRGATGWGAPPWAVAAPHGGPMRHPSAFDHRPGDDADACEHGHDAHRRGRGHGHAHGRGRRRDDVHVHVHVHHDGDPHHDDRGSGRARGRGGRDRHDT